VILLGLPLAVACTTAGAPGVADTMATVVTATVAGDSMKADKVSAGQVAGDGENDGALLLSLEGPAIAIAVVSVDAAGEPEHGAELWDTYVGDQVIPKAIGALPQGSATWQLAVFEGGASRNTSTGALAPLGAGKHELTLYVSDSGGLGKSHHYRAIIERPDHTLSRSNVFTF
jgi:hypothetical protein